jgi:hypothetical protein
MILGDNGPFYRSVALATHKFVEEEPFAYANSWNFAHIPPALVLDDPATKAPMIDEDGNYLVGLPGESISGIQYQSSTSPTHLRRFTKTFWSSKK